MLTLEYLPNNATTRASVNDQKCNIMAIPDSPQFTITLRSHITQLAHLAHNIKISLNDNAFTSDYSGLGRLRS